MQAIKTIGQTPLRDIFPGWIWKTAIPDGGILSSGFSPKSDHLAKEKVFNRRLQDDSIEAFLESPDAGYNVFVASDPDGDQAAFAAAWLASQVYPKLKPRPNVVWEQLNRFNDEQLTADLAWRPDLIIVSMLYEDMSKYRVERVRDIAEGFADVPKIFVCAGCDPITMASGVLHIPAHALFYTRSSLVFNPSAWH